MILKAKRTSTDALIQATVKNASKRDGDEVVQLYVTDLSGQEIRNLRGFQRIHLRAGESRTVNFNIGSDDLPKSKLQISIGGGQPLASIPHVEGTL